VIADPPAVVEARRRADDARERMMSSFEALLTRARQMPEKLAPGNLARGAWEAAKSKGADVAEDAVDAVRKRPVAASSAVAALALFIAREPLMDLAGKLMSSKPTKKPAKAARARARKQRVEKVDE
jgi:hypothetical protein